MTYSPTDRLHRQFGLKTTMRPTAVYPTIIELGLRPFYPASVFLGLLASLGWTYLLSVMEHFRSLRSSITYNTAGSNLPVPFIPGLKTRGSQATFL